MSYIKSVADNHRTVALALIFAIAFGFVLMGLTLSSVHGATQAPIERTAPAPEAPLSLVQDTLDALSPVPTYNLQQVNPGGPATMEECRELQYAGEVLRRSRNSFAITALFPDGSYAINWNEWADDQTGVDSYSIQRLRFQYRSNFKLVEDNSRVNAWDYTFPSVTSCWPSAGEFDSNHRALWWRWACNGITNIREDPSGTPTSPEQLQPFGDEWTTPSWTGSFKAPERHHNIPVSAMEIPGELFEQHADNPQSATDRLSQQQVDDATVDLTATDLEMHLFIITAHFDDDSTRSYHVAAISDAYPDRS